MLSSFISSLRFLGRKHEEVNAHFFYAVLIPFQFLLLYCVHFYTKYLYFFLFLCYNIHYSYNGLMTMVEKSLYYGTIARTFVGSIWDNSASISSFFSHIQTKKKIWKKCFFFSRFLHTTCPHTYRNESFNSSTNSEQTEIPYTKHFHLSIKLWSVWNCLRFAVSIFLLYFSYFFLLSLLSNAISGPRKKLCVRIKIKKN